MARVQLIQVLISKLSVVTAVAILAKDSNHGGTAFGPSGHFGRFLFVPKWATSTSVSGGPIPSAECPSGHCS
jgi:hypothetical protein